MAQLFDNQTKTVVNIPDGTTPDPSRYEPVGNQTLQMVSPDGKAYNLPASSAADAVTNYGWKFPTSQQAQVFADEDKGYAENAGAFKVGLHSALNQLGFGVPEIVEQHTHSAAYEQGAEKARGESPVARLVGGGLGLVGNVLATEGAGQLIRAGATGADVAAHVAEAGELAAKTGDAAEHGVINAVGADAINPATADAAKQGISAGARQMATESPGVLAQAFQSAKNAATMGAIYSAPSSIAQFAYGDKEAAAENLAIGTGFGGLLGLGHGFFTAGLDKGQGLLRDLLTKHEALDEAGNVRPDFFKKIADESELQQVGISKQDAAKLGQAKVDNIIDVMKKEKLQGADRDTILAKNKEAQQAISGHSQFLDDQFKFNEAPSQSDKDLAPSTQSVEAPITKAAPFVAEEHPDFTAYKNAYQGETQTQVPKYSAINAEADAEYEKEQHQAFLEDQQKLKDKVDTAQSALEVGKQSNLSKAKLTKLQKAFDAATEEHSNFNYQKYKEDNELENSFPSYNNAGEDNSIIDLDHPDYEAHQEAFQQSPEYKKWKEQYDFEGDSETESFGSPKYYAAQKEMKAAQRAHDALYTGPRTVGEGEQIPQMVTGEHPDYTAYKEAYTGPKETQPPPVVSEATKVPEPQPKLMGTTPKIETPQVGIKPTDLADQVKAEVIQQRPALTRPLYEDDLRELDKIKDHIASYGDDRRHTTLQDIKNSFSSEYANTIGKPPGMLTNREKMIKQVYDILKTKQEEVMKDSYTKLKMDTHYGQYLADKSKYAATADLLKYGPQQFDSFGNPLTEKVVPYGLRNTFISRTASAAATGLATGIGHFSGLGGLGGYFAIRPVIDMVLHHTLVDKGLDISTKVLRKLADNPETTQWVGAALTKELWDKSISKVASFPATIAGKTAATVANPIKSILGSDGTSGRTSDQQFTKLSNSIEAAAANPAMVQREVAVMTSIFGHDPELQRLLAQKQFATIKYLADNLPKPPPPQPFSSIKPEISQQDKQAFLDKLEIANSPDNIVAHMKDGSLNDNHLQAMQTLYPKRYQQYLGQVLYMAYDPKYANLPPKTIRTFATFAQNPALDPSLSTLPQDQAKYLQMGMPQPQGGMVGRKGTSGAGKGGEKSITSKATFNSERFPSAQTSTQRIQFK
jgi:hypothetical protein